MSITGEQKMLKTIMILSVCLLAAFSLSLSARAQDTEGAYTEGPVVQVTYIHVEYGKLAEYVDWLNSTWKSTLEAMRKAGLVLDYKVFRASPKTLDQPNIFLMITFKNMAALDRRTEFEAVANKAIGSTEVQNNARVARTDYRKVLGSELIRELVLK
jgi:L-rhamnose mutarotase